MPELPDITMYIEALERCARGEVLEAVRLNSVFLVRSVEPPIARAEGQELTALRRLGKRIVFAFDRAEPPLFLVLHLMRAGRLHWKRRRVRLATRNALCAFDFPGGTLLLTETSRKRRASLYVVQGQDGLAVHDPGGLELFDIDLEVFRQALQRNNHTLKRALTDPRIVAGIGSAYADEILHHARLSPVKLTQRLDEREIARLYEAARSILRSWTQRLREQTGHGWPKTVTAFRDGMAVHGRHLQPCPVCGDPVQRIVYAETETNYCATCQNGGKLLADRALSRILRQDWPRTLTELEELWYRAGRVV